MSEAADPRMTHARQVAAVLLNIDGRKAARVLHRLQPEQLNEVTRAMAELRAAPIDEAAAREALANATRRLLLGSRGGAWVETQAAVEATGDGAGGNPKNHPNGNPNGNPSGNPSGDQSRRDPTMAASQSGFAVFEKLCPDDLAGLLVNEHPQIAAVFIAHLDRPKAAALLRAMPVERRPDLVCRIATLDRTPTNVIERILEALAHKAEALALSSTRTEPQVWIEAAAEILKQIGQEKELILKSIGETNEAVAASIRDEMFRFEDLEILDRRSMQRMLGRIDSHTLAMALKSATPNVEARVFDNLSKRAGEIVIDERDMLGPVRLSRVIAAQRKIVELVRKLVDTGVIQQPNLTSEPMV